MVKQPYTKQMVKQDQNAIVIYVSKEIETKINETAKRLGLNKSSLCRMSAIKFCEQNRLGASE